MTRVGQSTNRWSQAGAAFLLVLLCSASSDGQVGFDRDSTAARIDALVADAVERDEFSGVILVSRGGEVLYDKSFGFADWELRVPNQPQTRFGVGSITKSFTEALVDMLVAEGGLDLDAPVERYLPEFPRGPAGGIPTVRHLLTHRAGVPHRVTTAVDETRPLNADDIVARVRATGLLFEPGSRRLYSSAGYTCLARIIETIGQRPFREILDERIFRAGRMADAVSETGQVQMPRRARPHLLGIDDGQLVVLSAPYKDLRFLTGAGSVFATARDLVRFAEASEEGVFGARLQQELRAAAPGEWIGATGRTNGYEAFLDLLPSEDLISVVLTNLQSAANWQIQEQLRRILVGHEPSPLRLARPPAPRIEAVDDVVGPYGEPETPVEVSVTGGRLFRGDNEFYAIDGGQYYVPVSGSTMRFRRDASGTVDAMVTVSGGGRETVLLRLPRR